MKKSFIILLVILAALTVKAQTFQWGSTDVRYKTTEKPAVVQPSLTLTAWKGELVNAQAVFTTPQNLSDVSVTVKGLKCGESVIPTNDVTCSFVREVITDRFDSRKDSSIVTDRLDESKSTSLKSGETLPIWISIQVPSEIKAGTYSGILELNAPSMSRSYTLSFKLIVCNKVLPPSSEWTFHLDLWQNPFAVARYFNVPLWSKEHFDRMRPIMTRLAKAGQKVITCSIIQHPWNSQTYDPFESMIAKMKQVDGTWKYDYTVFDQWVKFMMDCGINQQIDCYTLVPWQYEFDYYDCATNSTKKIACKPDQPAYRDFALPFLRDFAKHLKAKGWFNITCIAMDERPKDQMEAALSILREADPGYKIEGAANYNYWCPVN